jgi:hypothetical protein
MCAELVDGVMLVVHGATEPSATEWSACCDYACAKRQAARGELRTLVVTDSDVGPNARQRAEYKQKVAGPNNRVAVLCAGGVTRAILTAMAWFNPDMKPFGRDDIDRGLEYLESEATPRLMSSIARFRAHLASEERRNTG